MKINPNFNKKNRKIRNLGGIVNNFNKKSCLVDLKPLEEQKNREYLQIADNNHLKSSIDNQSKSHRVNIRIAKNYGFGLYFQNLREEILDKFLNYDEYISFDGLFKFQSLPDLFNFNKDQNPQQIDSSLNFHSNLNQSKLKNDQFLNHPFENLHKNNSNFPMREMNFNQVDQDENKEVNLTAIHANAIQKQIPKKHKQSEFYNDSEINFPNFKINKENDFEIENLKRNLDFYKITQESHNNSDKLETLKFNKNTNKHEYYNDNDKNLLEMTNNPQNCMREYSRSKLLNLQKLKDYCSKRKMI